MFESISHGHYAIPHGDSGPLLLSSLLHGAGLAAVILVPLFLAQGEVPTLPSMMAIDTQGQLVHSAFVTSSAPKERLIA